MKILMKNGRDSNWIDGDPSSYQCTEDNKQISENSNNVFERIVLE